MEQIEIEQCDSIVGGDAGMLGLVIGMVIEGAKALAASDQNKGESGNISDNPAA